MIIIKLQGRLGNQMFQYAFGYATARNLNTNFYLDQTESKFLLDEYFNIPKQSNRKVEEYIFDRRGIRRFKGKWYSVLGKIFTRNTLDFGADCYLSEVKPSLKNSTLFKGYFQSEQYFKPYEVPIRQFFSIKKNLAEAYWKQYEALFNKHHIVVVHIRKTDYMDLEHLDLGGRDLSLPLSYYHKLLAKLSIPRAKFIFISDDIDEVKKEFNYLEDSIFSDSNMITDFQHLLHADTCVIANSTFSWWAAWLNSKPNKQILAPRYFMGHLIKKNWPPEIYPNNWQLVDVGD